MKLKTIITIVILVIVVLALIAWWRRDKPCVAITSSVPKGPAQITSGTAEIANQLSIEGPTCDLLDLMTPSNLKANRIGKSNSWQISWNGVENSDGYLLDLQRGNEQMQVKTDKTSEVVTIEGDGGLDISLKTVNSTCDVMSVPISLHS